MSSKFNHERYDAASTVGGWSLLVFVVSFLYSGLASLGYLQAREDLAEAGESVDGFFLDSHSIDEHLAGSFTIMLVSAIVSYSALVVAQREASKNH